MSSGFYGVFNDMRSLYQGSMEERGIYEEVFSKVYSNLQSVSEEIGYYLENAYCVGRRVLEIACGDGNNYMIPMAKKGFQVDGVEISDSMIERFEEKSAKLSAKVKKNLRIIKGDIFNYEPDVKYDLIMIPSTTICLLADDEERLRTLFDNIHGWLNEGGRFMFDYRTDQILGNPYESEIVSQCNNKEKYFMMMQEFNNYIPGRAIVNMYVEKKEDSGDYKYLATSNKRIITDRLVNDLVENSRFKVHNIYEIQNQQADMKLMVLEK